MEGQVAARGGAARGGAARGGAALRPRPRRGFCVPDVRELMGLRKSKKGHSGTMQSGTGNPNLPENMTFKERQQLYFGLLKSNGIVDEEFETDFDVPQGIAAQEDEVVNENNLTCRGCYRDWAGSRREYFFLQFKSMRDNSPQIAGDMKAILKSIEVIKEDLQDLHEAVVARGGVPYGIPDQLLKNMEIPKAEKSKKRTK